MFVFWVGDDQEREPNEWYGEEQFSKCDVNLDRCCEEGTYWCKVYPPERVGWVPRSGE